MNATERDEFDALQWARVPEIPEEVGEGTPVWIYAIAKVTTNLLRRSYAIVRMDYGRTPVIVKSFTDEGIARIDSVHPYKFLDARFVPKLDSVAATKQYIATAYGVSADDVKGLKKPELLRLFYTHCIKTQLAFEKEQSQRKPV